MVTEELLIIKRGGIRYVAWHDRSSWQKVAPYHYWMLLPSNNVHPYLWQKWYVSSCVWPIVARRARGDVHNTSWWVVGGDFIEVSTGATASYVGTLPWWKRGVALVEIEECIHIPPRTFYRYWNTKLGNSFLFPISNTASKNGWTISIPLQQYLPGCDGKVAFGDAGGWSLRGETHK
jgi:hypothetical protein